MSPTPVYIPIYPITYAATVWIGGYDDRGMTRDTRPYVRREVAQRLEWQLQMVNRRVEALRKELDSERAHVAELEA